EERALFDRAAGEGEFVERGVECDVVVRLPIEGELTLDEFELGGARGEGGFSFGEVGAGGVGERGENGRDLGGEGVEGVKLDDSGFGGAAEREGVGDEFLE